MIEVEAKAKIMDVNSFLEKAGKIGKFNGKEKKIDDYYTLESKRAYPQKSLRIRKRKGRYEINFKKRISSFNKVQAKKETEFFVSDIDNFLYLIRDFGFKKWLRKEKETWLFEIKKNFHIEINKVKSLGWFVEVEYLCDNANIHMARKYVEKIMKTMGISRKNYIKEGYTKMLWEKMN